MKRRSKVPITFAALEAMLEHFEFDGSDIQVEAIEVDQDRHRILVYGRSDEGEEVQEGGHCYTHPTITRHEVTEAILGG